MDEAYGLFAYQRPHNVYDPYHLAICVLNGCISNSCFKKFAVLEGDGIGSLTLVF